MGVTPKVPWGFVPYCCFACSYCSLFCALLHRIQFGLTVLVEHFQRLASLSDRIATVWSLYLHCIFTDIYNASRNAAHLSAVCFIHSFASRSAHPGNAPLKSHRALSMRGFSCRKESQTRLCVAITNDFGRKSQTRDRRIRVFSKDLRNLARDRKANSTSSPGHFVPGATRIGERPSRRMAPRTGLVSILRDGRRFAPTSSG